ncbi:MAG: bifunctional DNA-formamidopyrimidine glycosylase/DNA-(apurinic or apyrimidinic site) lyase [Alphaproteobacteria bacterium]|nr:bifunctional DNA-formamidopyrimidine glycosylase/DNA-(apurinic or apyrimidinic site) lyase [Alphaproteobacteria bacterium]
MPELPEVETVRRGLEPLITGATIERLTLRRKNLRVPFTPDFAKRVQGATISGIKRRAKYLLFELSHGEVILSHLGMSGRFIVWPDSLPQAAKHDHVIMHFTDGRALVYHDPRRFGLMVLRHEDELAHEPLLASLGPEPLEPGFTAAVLKATLGKKTAPIKQVLMDPQVVVGVGNIYASEALFLSAIHPQRTASSAAKHSESLVRSIRQVLTDAIASGGSSLRDFLQVSGEGGYFQHAFKVYGRAGKACVRCPGTIETVRLAGRSSFYCPKCQK